MQEGLKSGNASETCRRHGIAPNLFYRWKDEADQGAKAGLGGKSAAAEIVLRTRPFWLLQSYPKNEALTV